MKEIRKAHILGGFLILVGLGATFFICYAISDYLNRIPLGATIGAGIIALACFIYGVNLIAKDC